MSRLAPLVVVLVAACALVPRDSWAVTLRIGDVIVADQNQTALGNDGRIVRVDPVNGAQTLISSGGLLNDPSDVALDPAGRLLVADANSLGFTGALIRIDPASGAQAVVSTGTFRRGPVGVGVGPQREIYVTQHGDGPGTSGVLRIDPITGAASPFSLGGLFRVASRITFDSTGNLLVSDGQARGPGIGAVIRVDRATGAQSFVSVGALRNATGIALEPDGQIIVSENDISLAAARIARIDPVTGLDVTLSTGGLLSLPAGLDIDLHGVLRVADLKTLGTAGSVIRIDRATGEQFLDSTGGLLFNPTGITTVVPEPALAPALPLVLGAAVRRRRSNRVRHTS